MTPPARRPADLFAAAGNGDRAAKARLLSLVERGGEAAREVGRLAAPLAGDAYTIGLTGAPGAGKSTLTSALIAHLRSLGEEVAVLAVDPSSPFTGGAILGDRVRMQDHATDPGVFIRSMATRGHLGGLSLATPEAIRLLDALGHRWILVETVGVGQVEVEVAGQGRHHRRRRQPRMGRQRAGQQGRPDGGRRRLRDQQGRPARRRRRPVATCSRCSSCRARGPSAANAGWQVPIIATVASSGEGVDRPVGRRLAHRDHAAATGVLERRRRFRLGEELREIVARRLEQRARELCTGERWDALTDDVLAGALDPWSAADEMLGAVDA